MKFVIFTLQWMLFAGFLDVPTPRDTKISLLKFNKKRFKYTYPKCASKVKKNFSNSAGLRSCLVSQKAKKSTNDRNDVEMDAWSIGRLLICRFIYFSPFKRNWFKVQSKLLFTSVITKVQQTYCLKFVLHHRIQFIKYVFY